MPALAGDALVSPLVSEMLQRLDAEILRYERVIQYWPVFGPLLEGAVCAVLRETTTGVVQQCSAPQGQPPSARGPSRAGGGPATPTGAGYAHNGAPA